MIAPRKLLVLFLLVAGIPFAALAWLGWRLLEQDRALETQRLRERLENAASRLSHQLDNSLEAWEKGAPAALPPGATLLVFGAGGVVQQQGVRLPYYPLVPSPPEAPASAFAAAEAQEFQGGDLAKAVALYRGLARTDDRRVRAGALMRLARCLRKQQQFREALAVYGELAKLGETAVAGSPAELVARRERIALFRSVGDEEARKRESALLAVALDEGRFRVDRATYEFFRGAPPQSNKLAETVEALWPRWQQQASGGSTWPEAGRAWATVWRRMPSGTGAVVASIQPASEQAMAVSRRNLLVAGFALMLLVIAAAGYFVFRAVSRELSVARLQSDFVAAVSHEFRTPLTAMCHLTEMLEEGGTPGDRLPLYYRTLGKETRRLHGMVESLLDFARMEAGRRVYHMEDLDAAELVRQVVGEFHANAHRIELHAPAEERRIHADREGITRALRNLLDNAVKYSPEASTVRVSVEARGERIAIAVRDEGAGIPKQEQRKVFRKFVRGSSSGNLNVKGTGIGLAMVNYIVKAHHGHVELESEPGRGSTFTILLPK